MKLIVGLGNPTAQYERTRHNVGFRAVEHFAARHRVALEGRKWKAVYGTGEIRGEKVLLLLPQTYMNLSGEAAGAAMRFFKASLEDVVAVHDELDLPLGRLQLKKGGGSAGHNGLKSLVEHLGGADFLRMRVGISRPPPQWDSAAYVLAQFAGDEERQLEGIFDKVSDGLDLLIEKGASAAMNAVNRRPENPGSGTGPAP
jgi:PTH1 family peptidyl-tRNA hydrolase